MRSKHNRTILSLSLSLSIWLKKTFPKIPHFSSFFSFQMIKVIQAGSGWNEPENLYLNVPSIILTCNISNVYRLSWLVCDWALSNSPISISVRIDYVIRIKFSLACPMHGE